MACRHSFHRGSACGLVQAGPVAPAPAAPRDRNATSQRADESTIPRVTETPARPAAPISEKVDRAVRQRDRMAPRQTGLQGRQSTAGTTGPSDGADGHSLLVNLQILPSRIGRQFRSGAVCHRAGRYQRLYLCESRRETSDLSPLWRREFAVKGPFGLAMTWAEDALPSKSVKHIRQ